MRKLKECLRLNRWTMGLVVGIQILGCSGARVTVIETADNESRPDWVSTIKTSFKKGNQQFYIGYTTVPGDSNPSAAFNMSDAKALSAPLASFSDQFLDQNSVGEDLRHSTGQRLISTLRKTNIPIPSLQVTARYWERVKIDEGEGVIKTELRVYSLAEVSVSDLAAAKQEVFKKLQGDPEIKNLLGEVAKEQRDRAFKEDRKPAASVGDSK